MEEIQSILTADIPEEELIPKWYQDPKEWFADHGPNGRLNRFAYKPAQPKHAAGDERQGRVDPSTVRQEGGADHGVVNPHRGASGHGRIA